MNLIDPNQLVLNDPPSIIWITVSDAFSLLWEANPKAHDLENVKASIHKHGFQELPKFDPSIGIKAGNGRIEALFEMEADPGYELPRGLGHTADGRWAVPILVGTDAESRAAASAYALDSNNLVLLGGDFSAADLLRLYNPAAFLAVVNEIAADDEYAVSVPADDIAGLMEAYEELLIAAGGGSAAGIGQAGPGTENDAAPQISRAAELAEEWGTAAGQLWRLPAREEGRPDHYVLCGDATNADDVARLMRGGGGEAMAEMIWTDPPYGVAVGDKNKFLDSIDKGSSNRVTENLENDTLDEEGLEAMLRAAFRNASAVCLAGGAWYVAAPAGPLHVVFGGILKEMGIWRQTIQWVKNNATFAPMGVDYHWQAEPIFYGWLPGAGHRYYGGRQQTTVWEIDRPSKSPEHPTMKPVELVQRSVINSSLPGQIVFDPFTGSGTTILAAENSGRAGRGIEISPGYLAVILHRYWEAFEIRPVLVE